MEKLQELIPVPWLWVVLPLIVVAILFFLDVGDKLSGIFGWLGIENPLRRPEPSESDRQKVRRQLLQILTREIDYRLETSLYERVKLDLYMEDQRQRVGKPKTEVIPEDSSAIPKPGMRSLINRVLRPFRKQSRESIPLESTQKIVDVFDRDDIQGKLLILGEPGSGKTTELLHLAKDLLERVSKDDNLPIPLILELSAWDEGKTINQWIAGAVKKKHDIPESITLQWLQQDEILPLLDGLDELGLANQQKCIDAINTFMTEKVRYGLVVCCRREEYEAGQVQLHALNGAVYLEHLRPEQIQRFFKELNRARLWEQIRDNSTLLELARSPLFLSMLVVAYQGKPITSEAVLFDAFITQKLKEGNSNVYPPNKSPSPQQTRHYLVWLAQQLEKVGETEFLIEGLQPNLLSRKGLRIYKLIFGLIFGLSWGLIGILILGPTSGLLFGLIGGLIGSLNHKLSTFIQTIEKLIFSFSNILRDVLSIGWSVGLIFGLPFGLAGGLAGGLTGGLAGGLTGGLPFGLIFGLPFGLIFGVFFGLRGGLRGELINEKTYPNQGIWKSLQNSITVTLIFGLIFGLPFGLPSGLTIGLILGLKGGLGCGLIFGLKGGLQAVIQHLALRIVLTKNGYTPWNYARFLEHAVELRFIQRVGGRYRFVHDLLRKHFAAMQLE